MEIVRAHDSSLDVFLQFFSVQQCLVSTTDVASLAGVKRAAVSMWKKRKTDSEFPFPQSIYRAGQTDYFAIPEIVSWLESSGLGNNPEVAKDAYCYAALELLGDPSSIQELIEALIVLRAEYGSPLSADLDFLVSAADDVDPEDEFLFSEIKAFASAQYLQSAQDSQELQTLESARKPEEHKVSRETVIELVHLMYDNSYSASHVLALLDERGRNHNQQVRGQYMDRELVGFVAELIGGLAQIDGRKKPLEQCVDLVSSHLDVVEQIRAQDNLNAQFTEALAAYPFFMEPSTARLNRRALRRMVASGRAVETLNSVDDYSEVDAAFFGFIPPTASESYIEEVFESRLPAFIDGDVDFSGVLIGPRDLLTGNHRAGERIRSELVRQGVLRVTVLLPQGLYPNHPREQLAMWVLDKPSSRPDPQARVYLADLQGIVFRSGKQSLLADLLAAVRDSNDRSYKYLSTQTVSAVSGSSALSFSTRGQSYPTSPAMDAVAIQQGLLALKQRVDFPDFEVSTKSQRRPHTPKLSLADAQRARFVAFKPGAVIESDWTKNARPGDLSARVLDKAVLQLLCANPSSQPHDLHTQALDAFVLGQIESIQLTKPGDVVFFQHGNSRGVWVDSQGGNVVAQPLRVLRPRSPRISSSMVAQDLAGFQTHANAWRKWEIRVLPDAYVGGISAVLDQVAQAKQQLFEQLSALNSFEQVFGDAVSRGGVRVEPLE